MDAFDLTEAIHKFHRGPARELFSRYGHANVDLAVAQAIHRGLVSRDEVGDDLLNAMARHLALLQELDPSAVP
jgi:hypothetical protein